MISDLSMQMPCHHAVLLFYAFMLCYHVMMLQYLCHHAVCFHDAAVSAIMLCFQDAAVYVPSCCAFMMLQYLCHHAVSNQWTAAVLHATVVLHALLAQSTICDMPARFLLSIQLSSPMAFRNHLLHCMVAWSIHKCASGIHRGASLFINVLHERYS
jgi:hypothetical protein